MVKLECLVWVLSLRVDLGFGILFFFGQLYIMGFQSSEEVTQVQNYMGVVYSFSYKVEGCVWIGVYYFRDGVFS